MKCKPSRIASLWSSLIVCFVLVTGTVALGQGNLRIGTHPTATSYNAVGSGIAQVVTANSDLRVLAVPFAGPNAWMPLFANEELELGVLSAPDAFWAFSGAQGYRETDSVRLLLTGGAAPTFGLIVRANGGISSVEDLQGRRVTSNYGGNQIISLILEAHLASVGLSWDDVRQVPVTDVASGFNALQENRVDAAFGGAGSAAQQQLEAAIDVTGLHFGDVSPEQIESFPEDALAAIRSRLPGARPLIISAEESVANTDIVGIGYPIVLIGRADIDEETAYQMVKAVWENHEDLWPVHVWLQEWTPETMFTEDPVVPYHEGAVRYFREIGLWTEAAEENQQRLLSDQR